MIFMIFYNFHKTHENRRNFGEEKKMDIRKTIHIVPRLQNIDFDQIRVLNLQNAHFVISDHFATEMGAKPCKNRCKRIFHKNAKKPKPQQNRKYP